MVILALILSCAGGKTADEAAPIAAVEVAPSSAVPWLTRASIDVRGVRPSETEIAQVEADPEAVYALIDNFLSDPRFEEQLVSLYSEVFLTPAESFDVSFASLDLPESDRPLYLRSIGEEPLRILAHIAAQDLPYTELVTGDWTMANGLLGQIWPLDISGTDADWQVAHYTDGRPNAGVLSTNGMWWRFTSSTANLNRKRANQLSRILLCHDYLTRPIDFDRDVNLLDEDAVADAIKNDPGCVNCHASLDPLASYLFGFWYVDPESAVDSVEYHPERELLWQQTSGVAPAFYGEAGTGLASLGHQIAADPRFVECAVEQAFTRMMRREIALDDTDALTVHREAFLDSGLQLKDLMYSVLTHPRYRPQSAEDAATVPGQVTTKMITAEQLASQVAELTGFVWTSGDTEMIRTDAIGVGNLAGRADGVRVTKNATSPNTTSILVAERLTEAATGFAIANELEQARADRRLFTEVELTATPTSDPTGFVAQVQALHLRILSRRISEDGPEVTANTALFNELLAAEGDPIRAWAGLLWALLRDPDFILY
jgi:hypothetical protein